MEVMQDHNNKGPVPYASYLYIYPLYMIQSF